ncbi:cysteine--tRNA ligase, partial [Candidatus Gottesmanbacteria bacterium]|nr:cysteine--tRNA ligase [Candidatus Gottesmanbacteria bacterium]
FGYKVKFVMNITDVGHLTSNSDTGEDKMEKGAKREGKTAWDIAKFYTQAFLADSKKLNLMEPDVRPKPTEHIAEQIAMVETLLARGFAYRIDDGVYFDTSKFAGYGALTGQNIEELKAGSRVEPNPQKRNPTDFALWKFSPKDKKRDMEWDSPWGVGFPGWHIECSAMSRKHLGDQIDIHTGGADLIPIHHTNEIAQSEATTGKSPFVRFWVHGQFILVDGEKMSKSKENFYRLSDIEAKNFDSLALRYFYMTAHYRAFLNFTWTALESAQASLNELRAQVLSIKNQVSRHTLSPEKVEKVDAYRKKFGEALANDLNMPEALAAVWEVIKSNIPSQDKYDLLMDFDEILGFGLKNVSQLKVEEMKLPKSSATILSYTQTPLSGPTISRLDERELARQQGNYGTADKLREDIRLIDKLTVEDTSGGTVVKRTSD